MQKQEYKLEGPYQCSSYQFISLTHNDQAVLASCNADTDLVPVCYEPQVCPQPPNISLLLLRPTNCDVF